MGQGSRLVKLVQQEDSRASLPVLGAAEVELACRFAKRQASFDPVCATASLSEVRATPMQTMQALVKKSAEPGLWLEDVPVPTIGINDVLIRVLRTGICGTDLHIYNWDAWAQKTIPVPLVIGHEFVGEIVEVGSNVKDFHLGEIVSGEGHVVCGRCRNCLAGRRHLCKDTQGVGVNRPGAFAEYLALPMTNVWRPRSGHPARRAGDLRSVRQRRPYRPVVRRARRGRADHRRRPDRLHGRRRRAARRRPARGRHRRQPLSPGAGPQAWARRCAIDVRTETHCRRCSSGSA